MFSKSELWTGQGHCLHRRDLAWHTVPGELGVSLESQRSRVYLWDVVAIHVGVLCCHSWHVEGDNVAFPLHFMDDSVGVVQVVPVLQGWWPCLADDCINLGLHPGWGEGAAISPGKKPSEPYKVIAVRVHQGTWATVYTSYVSVGTFPTALSQSCDR